MYPCCNFDGSTSSVVGPSNVAVRPELADFTVSGWFRSFARDGSDTADQYIVSTKTTSISQQGFGILLYNAGAYALRFIATGAGGAITNNSVIWNTNCRDGNWRHFVHSVDRDGNRVTYGNGTAVVTADASAWATNSIGQNHALTVGSQPDGATVRKFYGQICDVRVWKGHALSSGEAAAVYSGALDVALGNLTFWYPFDEGIGSTAIDRSASGLNGTIVGADPWIITQDFFTRQRLANISNYYRRLKAG